MTAPKTVTVGNITITFGITNVLQCAELVCKTTSVDKDAIGFFAPGEAFELQE